MMFRTAIFATIAYADVFDYPLTRDEVEKWMVQKSKFRHIPQIDCIDGYFFLNGRKKIVTLRKERRRWSGEKLRVAKHAALLLKYISTIQLIGITGALAMDNAHRDDDIDFYIVAKSGTLWTTRFFATVLLALFGLRRKPDDITFRNKICLNMYVDEEHLSVPKRERDLFAAHEVLQMKPLWERNGIYQKFLSANDWARQFLPNVLTPEKYTFLKEQKISVFRFFEPLARVIQLWYMRHRKTSELVSPILIRFHPRDAREWVRSKLAARLAKQKIPLDKIFFAR